MAYLMDGHNLIPRMPGLQLSDPDDEEKLIRLLQEFCRLRRKTVEVFFDRAPAGQSGKRQYGQVKAVFVRSDLTADEAIIARLKQLGKRSRNYTVVSSDRQVQQAARASHARVISSESFAAEWARLIAEEPELDPRNRLLSQEEMAAWENLFKRGHPPSDENMT